MARKAGQLISRGSGTWLIRISLGRDPETGTRKDHNKTLRGSFREAQTYLNGKLQEREIGRLHVRRRSVSINTWTSGSQRQPSRDSARKATSITKRC